MAIYLLVALRVYWVEICDCQEADVDFEGDVFFDGHGLADIAKI